MTEFAHSVPAVPPLPTADAPIADLTYRNYDGPLNSLTLRWWTIALTMFRQNLKPAGFKIVAILAVLPYLFIIALLYIQGRINSAPGGGRVGNLLPTLMDNTVGQKYAIQFYNAMGFQLLYLVIIALIAGAGCIAADNKNNALLIYLSKPITKNDYLLGKWVGLFLTMFLVSFGPALLLYLYCLVSYMGDGFLRDEPRLIWHILESTVLVSAMFTSIMIGLSAWSKSPRIIGAIIAGIYFASQVVSFAVWMFLGMGNPTKYPIISHSSIGGVMSGLTQGIYGVTIHSVRMHKRSQSITSLDIIPPPAGVMWGIALGFIILGIIAARAKIRAVEVIS